MFLSAGIQKRLQRQRRRLSVGRAYDMALEVARLLPENARVLDVGCGNGYIAHHLAGLIGARVMGIDVTESTAAQINYRSYDGRHFPVADGSFDAVLLCYVLHHAQEARLVLDEVKRVLTPEGRAIIYEDIPSTRWDRTVCWTHNRKWQHRTGRCTFQLEKEWRKVFSAAGFEIVSERSLSRWRNLAHPVNRSFFVLEASESIDNTGGVRENTEGVREFQPRVELWQPWVSEPASGFCNPEGVMKVVR